MQKLSVEAEPEEEPESGNKNIGALPDEWWFLVELVLNECPEAPLKAFRKSIIGRGKPLTAAQADAAIKGAKGATATGKIDESQRVRKREHVPETTGDKIVRADWYIRQQMPVIFARHADHKFTDEEHWLIDAARDLECTLVFLQFDDEAVDRVESID